MSTITPTVTAYDLHAYRKQIENVEEFAPRLHIDVMDGILAPVTSPPLTSLWLPDSIPCDIHMMYMHPERHLKTLIRLKPHMVIVHAESKCNFERFSEQLHAHGIRMGVALLQDTRVNDHLDTLQYCEHCLIFSGHLGFHGGLADLTLLKKADQVRTVSADIEIGWDGGINHENISELAQHIDVLNIGGAIQKSESPFRAYSTLIRALH